jgi:hypothetical protein
MIAGCYTLDLYCDTPGCPMGRCEDGAPPFQATDEKGSTCRKKARQAGWWLNNKSGAALCPSCAAKRRAVDSVYP